MEETVVALAGNPNVGKSTVFNALTGLHQHTGNWPGKTVALAEGQYVWRELRFRLVDLPGTYSLAVDSPEEEIARDFLACGGARVVVVVTDATCLRRSLALALQIRQRTARMVLCVNLLDEAEKKGIDVDLARLSARVGAPVVGMAARSGRGLDELRDAVAAAAEEPAQTDAWQLRYDVPVERALARLAPALDGDRMRALALLERGAAPDAPYYEAWGRARVVLDEAGLAGQALSDSLAASVVRAAEEIAGGCVRVDPQRGHTRDRRIDRLLTSRRAGIPAMLLLLAGVLYLTIRGANVPSELLSRWLLGLQEPLRGLLAQLGAPLWLQGAAVDGVYRTAAWVTAVMLPPMAIFFPLFTLLEDAGYLPRVAFNLDRLFRAAGAHGRQSLTMCMGFGCNACGVTGCRIIDSPRERLVAILSNCFVPCNGRFPTLLALISLFFLGGSRGAGRTLLATGLFLLVILFSVAKTLLAVGVFAGAAAVPDAADRARARALAPRPDALRPRAGGDGRRADGAAHLGARERPRGRRAGADAGRGVARPAGAADGTGRDDPAGVCARLSRKRDCAADPADGVSAGGQSHGLRGARRAADRLHGERLDGADGGLHGAAVPDALPVRDDGADHPA